MAPPHATPPPPVPDHWLGYVAADASGANAAELSWQAYFRDPVLQRLIEGVFMRQNDMMHIHVWRKFDSQFRLITARRNPNMVILFAGLVVMRPDWGIIGVAAWTAVSLVVHLVRLVQAIARKAKGETLVSWLA